MKRSQSSVSPKNGEQIGNLILLGLPPQEREQLSSSLEFVRLKLHQVLYDVGDTIKSLYFLNNELASVLAAQIDGKIVEVGLIGDEGYVGLPAPFGFKTSAHRVVVQGDATGYRLDASHLEKIALQCPTLLRQLQQFVLILSMQSTQLAACNRLHDARVRPSRHPGGQGRTS